MPAEAADIGRFLSIDSELEVPNPPSGTPDDQVPAVTRRDPARKRICHRWPA